MAVIKPKDVVEFMGKTLPELIRDEIKHGIVWWCCMSCGTEYRTDKTPNTNFVCTKCKFLEGDS